MVMGTPADLLLPQAALFSMPASGKDAEPALPRRLGDLNPAKALCRKARPNGRQRARRGWLNQRVRTDGHPRLKARPRTMLPPRLASTTAL